MQCRPRRGCISRVGRTSGSRGARVVRIGGRELRQGRRFVWFGPPGRRGATMTGHLDRRMTRRVTLPNRRVSSSPRVGLPRTMRSASNAFASARIASATRSTAAYRTSPPAARPAIRRSNTAASATNAASLPSLARTSGSRRLHATADAALALASFRRWRSSSPSRARPGAGRSHRLLPGSSRTSSSRGFRIGLCRPYPRLSIIAPRSASLKRSPLWIRVKVFRPPAQARRRLLSRRRTLFVDLTFDHAADSCRGARCP